MAGGSYDVVVDERPAEAPAAPSPRVVELAGLNGATPLEALALRARRDGRDVGALVAHIFVALRTRRDEARDVCRVCLGAGLVRSADDDDDGSEKLLRDCCGLLLAARARPARRKGYDLIYDCELGSRLLAGSSRQLAGRSAATQSSAAG